MKRRAFLKLGGQMTVAGTLVSQLTACLPETDDLGYKGAMPFLHGVASGDPLHNRVILWTRISQDESLNASVIPVGYLVATDPEFKHIVATGNTQALAEKDFTVKVDVPLPEPDSTYYYGFEALGYFSPMGRTRTTPHPDTAAHEVNRIRLAVCSCSNLGFGYFNAYANIAKRKDISAVLHLGDYIYEHQQGFYCDPIVASQRPLDPKHEIISLDDYRRRYACYRRDVDLQECHRQHPFIVVWDDHEIANDSWKHGAQNHQSNEGDYETRKMAAVQAYHEWMPIRDNDSNTLDSELRIYRRFQFGKLLDLNMLDTRIFGREKPDTNASHVPERQLLGLEQENWLYLNLLDGQSRGAIWQLLGQQIILAPFKGSAATGSSDIWNGYASARTRLLDFIKTNQIDNTVVLTGDYHASFAFDICHDPFDPTAYDPHTGEGSIAVEYVCPAVTSGTFPEIAGPHLNPHQKFNNQFDHGYMLLDISEEKCQCEWYFVATLHRRELIGYYAKGLATYAGSNHLVAAEKTTTIATAANLAPEAAALGRKKPAKMI